MSTTVLRCSLGDLAVSSGLLRLPLRGNWVAHLELGFTAAPAEDSPATLLLFREDGTEDDFVGTVRRSGILAGSETVTVTLVGGAGLLLEDVPPRSAIAGSTTLPAGLVARGICDDAGEEFADGVELALDAYQLERWDRLQMSAKDALDILVDRLGLGWRVLADGTIWVGVETFPAVTNAAVYVGGDPADGLVRYAPNGAPLRPGTTIDGLEASAVEYQIAPGSIRAEVRSQLAGDPPRVVADALYRVSYAAEVKQQIVDGTVDVVADDPRIGDLLSVDVRVGIPGALVTVPPFTRLRVVFEGADPRGAYATAIDQEPGARAAVSLVGDDVDLGYLTGTAGATPVTFAISPISVPGAVHLTGKVTGPGSIRVKLQ